MKDITWERIRLEERDTGAFGELERTEVGLRAQADVVAQIISRMGYCDKDADDGKITEKEAAIRRDTLIELAGDIGVGLAVKVIYDEPIPPADGRHVEIPKEVCELEEAAARQVSLIAILDGNEVTTDFHILGAYLRAQPDQDLREVLEDWERA